MNKKTKKESKKAGKEAKPGKTAKKKTKKERSPKKSLRFSKGKPKKKGKEKEKSSEGTAKRKLFLGGRSTSTKKEDYSDLKTSAPRSRKMFLRFSTKDQVFFAKRLSFLIGANVPILDSLRILLRQTKSKPKKWMFSRIIEDVTNGQFLAASLEKFSKVFGDFAINIIRTGETSGTLDESLKYLADELEKKQKLKKKVFGALIYPGLIITATLGIVGMLTIYVFPKILPIFASLDFELPITTKILIWMTDFMTAWGLWIGLGIVILAVFISWFIAVKENAHYFWDKFVLKVPLLGKIALNYQMANLTRTLGLLLKTDAGVVKSFAIAASTTSNMAYRRALSAVSDSIVMGESISSQLLKRPDLFPDMMAQMIAIGERTGKLSDTFLYLSGLYETEVEDLTKNLSNAIEPLLMIFMGVIVGFIAISIITPIYQVTQNLNP